MADTIDITTLTTWVDSRDLIRRREDLVWLDGMGYDMAADERRELDVLNQFVKQGETIKGWDQGTTVIADVGWEQFAKDYVNDLMAVVVSSDATDFLIRHLDWKSVVDEMQNDYVDFTVVESKMPYIFWVRG